MVRKQNWGALDENFGHEDDARADDDRQPPSEFHQNGQQTDNQDERTQLRDQEGSHSTFSGSRRDFLKVGAAAAAGTLGLGSSGQAAATTKIAEERNGGMLNVNEDFRLIDNQWGNPSARQGVWVNDDGSYGWDFDASGTTNGINYPEVFLGTRPWGSDTGVAEFPIRRGDVDEFVLDVQAEYSISGGEWDWAHEWWLMEKKPSVETKTYKYEIMLLLDWGGGHDHGTPVYTDLWTDRYGNTIDLWALYDSGGTSSTFYIFRIQGGHDGGKIDMKRITDWLTNHEGIREDLWISGCELGNEYWPEAVGNNTISEFSVTINGSTYTNVGDNDVTSPDAKAPTAPSNLSSPSRGELSVELAWEATSDSGGSGVEYYNVYLDGSIDHEVSASTTSTIVSDLSSGTGYEFAVTAVDGAGNESTHSNVVSVTTASGGDGSDDIQSGVAYRIENANSGLVLDVDGASTTDGSSLLQYPWDGNANQRWVVTDNGDGTYRLENDHSGKVADVEGGSTSEGADVLQWSWHNGGNQRWKLISNGDGTYRLENDHSELVLAVNHASTRNGANVKQEGWNGGDNQRWVLSTVDSTEDATVPTAPSNLLSPSRSESSIELAWETASDSGGSGVEHYNVYLDGSIDHEVAADTTSTIVSDLSSGTGYEFAVTAVDGAGNESTRSNVVSVTTAGGSDGSDDIQSGAVYRIENANSGLVLDVDGASTMDGSSLLQRPWDGNPNQQWVVTDNGDGTYRLENDHSGSVADVKGGSTDEGADVLQWSWHGGDNQRWNLVPNGDGTYRLENNHSGLVLDVNGASSRNGANVQQWAWNGGDNQRWVLSTVDSR